MALEVQNLTRQFSYKKDNKTINLPDPNPEFSVIEVMKFYAPTYPELTNGLAEGPVIIGDKANYTIKTQAGQLG